MKLRDLKTHALLKFNKINKLALLSGGCRLHRSNVIYFLKWRITCINHIKVF